MIELKDICKNYKNKTVLQHLNFTIDKGQRIAIFGENGCGKTTLLKIIVGQIKSFSGGVYYQNTDLRISALIETPQFIETWSGEENLFYFLKRNELKNTKRYIELFGLSDDIERKVSSYSLGMKQKLLLVLALSREFDLLLLDEPYIALDSEAVQNLDKTILEMSNKGKSIVVVSHIINQFTEQFISYKFSNGGLFPLRYEQFDYYKYRMVFADPAYKTAALDKIEKIKIIEESQNELICLIPRNRISEYIKYFSDYSLVQAQKLQVSLYDVNQMEIV